MSAVKNKLRQFSDDFQQYLLNEIELKDEEKVELHWRRFSYQIFVFFVIFIGVPVWYFTTTPYRASLPYFGDEFHVQIKALFGKSLSLQTTDHARGPDVWSQMTIFPTYNVHLVFIHEANQQLGLSEGSHILESETQRVVSGVQKFADLFNETLKLKLSVEHFFDFSLEDFIVKHCEKENQAGNMHLDDNSAEVNKSLIFEKSKVSALTTEIDRWSTQPVGSEPLIKIAVFDSTRVHFSDEQKIVKGLAVASWGGVVAAAASEVRTSLNAIFAILKIQLGVNANGNVAESKFVSEFLETSLSYKKSTRKVLLELEAHKLRLTMDNLLQTIHYINSLHGLKDKIEDLVISDEVAQLAYTAVQKFYISYTALIEDKKIDASSSATARLLAEKAVTHYSLLEFLNFPSDQKYGIYVPLFFPLLFPVIQPLFLLLLFLLKGKKAVEHVQQKPAAENSQ